ncbi:hypothetical protein [Flexibacterium corallicola]|uniref:hypothetical protein n=1 Tax=Flexibacterium corallicola TaxID=3037259 RepID=UPI00286EE786|nr:hypothetical protein [Pseudovibrio sp. M1P-2-3]
MKNAPETRESVRQLIYVPIVHDSADMGSQAESMKQVYLEKFGEKAWEESRRAVAAFWECIEQEINGLELNYARVRLYQDGLPLCGQETKIIADIAKTGSNNFRILQDLIQRGAKVEGTEDPELLRAEHALVASGDLGSLEVSQKARELMEKRDLYISQRIDATLEPDETGILFIGALHNIRSVLPKTIKVHPLIEI